MEDIKELKKECFLPQVQKGRFSLRLKVLAGNISADDLEKITHLAKKYGQGYVHLTSRQGIEIPFIKFEDIAEVRECLSKMGLSNGACGPKVRTITACQGAAVCPSGLIDTAALAAEFDKRYYKRPLPGSKFKIGITGCQNNCLRAEANDLGIKGALAPKWDKEACCYCGLCAEACRYNALEVNKDSKEIVFTPENCTYCGRCAKACPSGACSGERGFMLFFGGTFGNLVEKGEALTSVVFSEEKLHETVEATLEFFAANITKPGERFRTILDRIGWETFKENLK